GQLECAGQRLEHLERGPDVASLLEPRVPGGADVREQRDLLAPQTGRPPPPAVRKTDVFGRDALAPLSQKVGQLLTAPLAISVIWLSDLGWSSYYQDNSLSCTWIRIVAQCHP